VVFLFVRNAHALGLEQTQDAQQPLRHASSEIGLQPRRKKEEQEQRGKTMPKKKNNKGFLSAEVNICSSLRERERTSRRRAPLWHRATYSVLRPRPLLSIFPRALSLRSLLSPRFFSSSGYKYKNIFTRKRADQNQTPTPTNSRPRCLQQQVELFYLHLHSPACSPASFLTLNSEKTLLPRWPRRATCS